MNASSLRQAVVEWMAIACAVTVFVAAALDIPDDAAPAGRVQSASVHPGR